MFGKVRFVIVVRFDGHRLRVQQPIFFRRPVCVQRSETARPAQPGKPERTQDALARLVADFSVLIGEQPEIVQLINERTAAGRRARAFVLRLENDVVREQFLRAPQTAASIAGQACRCGASPV